jgi:alpha-1,2-mannosyltransferase
LIAALDLGPRTQRLLIALVALVVALDLGKVVHRRMHFGGDFDISREFGRRFLTGEYLYKNGLHFVYLPSAAMYFSPLAMLPTPIAFLAWFTIAILCAWLTLRMWQRMVSQQDPVVARRGFLIGFCAVFLASHFLIRDLDDGGPHVILLAILSAGIYSTFNRRTGLGATWLGLAIAIKVTPGLFIPFFLWKREWRLAFYTAFASACWIALPILRMGPVTWYHDMYQWVFSAAGFAIGKNAAMVFRGKKTIHNQSLHAACLYLLEKTAMSAQLSNDIAILVTISVVVVFCWITRRRFESFSDPAWPAESSALLVLMVLLSPITWEQHLVLMLPALYLIVAEGAGTTDLEIGIIAPMTVFVLLALVFTRDLIGKENYAVLLGYHVQTICTLIVFSIALLKHPSSSSMDQEQTQRN